MLNYYIFILIFNFSLLKVGKNGEHDIVFLNEYDIAKNMQNNEVTAGYRFNLIMKVEKNYDLDILTVRLKTKKDLGFTGKIKKGNAFKNMRIFKETKAIGTLNSDLAFSANKVIKKALNKNTDKFEDIKMEEKNFIQQQKIQKDLMKKTEEIINESIFRKNECIKSINKFYE